MDNHGTGGAGYSHVMCSVFNASQAEILHVMRRQAACARQHALCVLDDFGTGGLGGDDGGSIDAFAGWGSRRFKGITWRKIQLVQDILLQVTASSFWCIGLLMFSASLCPGWSGRI